MAQRLEYWPETELPGIMQGYNQGGLDNTKNERNGHQQQSLVDMYATAQHTMNQYHSVLPLAEGNVLPRDQLADKPMPAFGYQAERASSVAPQASIDDSGLDEDRGENES